MSKNKRTEMEQERDLALISDLYVRKKWTQAQIAAHLSELRPYSLTQQQISYDLGKIRDRWLESSLVNFDEARAQELAEIDRVEVEAWEAFERSKHSSSQTITTKGKLRKTSEGQGGYVAEQPAEAKRSTQEGAGNPTFLQIVQWCIDRRIHLLGLDAPDRVRIEQLQISLTGDDIRKARREAESYAQKVIDGNPRR